MVTYRIGTTRAAIALVALAIPATALAHVERTSYWPDPRPDTSVTPPVGGKVPTARSLSSALNAKALGDTRVVCQDNSMSLVRAEIAQARKSGVELRPTQVLPPMSKRSASNLLRLNTKFFAR